MDGEDAIDTFMALTNAPRHVAQHVLDAHAGDLEAGISFYLEGGGVGHGVTGPSGSLDPVLYTAALSAQEQPRSSPLTALVDPDLDDEDEPGFAGPVSGWDGAGEALGDDGEWPARPPAGPATLAAAAGLPDVDLEEQRMLLAAYAGEAYEPPPAPGPSAAGPLSPRAQERAVLRSEQDAAFHASLQADRAKAEAARGAAERAAREAREAAEAAEDRAALEREAREARERDLDERAARLPAEPAAERPDAVRLLVRLPGGARLTRRFGAEDAVPAVFAWVDVSCRDDPAAPTPGSYRLVAQAFRLGAPARGNPLGEAWVLKPLRKKGTTAGLAPCAGG
ncbi:FAS-associated factor 2-B [Auxenochlorella protothecoides]|uniref:FAS-associated factor 2-B n=1 Tax=Auxenochlorella protothecoides TaxID=3075 RepID=A0A087SAV9_AUXPR|nr:FAS-associated factor 2-B [Auxenochlorella protothecoides]KFM22863.1 FAS-associated factor 2-B [Auxenochlorella protothecoides]